MRRGGDPLGGLAGNASTTFAGVLANGSGTVALTKTGTGTLTLSGANTYTGGTTLTGGVIRVQSNGALGTTAGGTTVASGTAIEIDGSGLAIAEPITSLIGTGGGTGALRNLANANTWSGAIDLGAAAGATIASDAGTLTLATGGITGNTRPLTVTGAGNTTITSVIGTTSGHAHQDRGRHPRALGHQHLHRGDDGERGCGPRPVERRTGHDRERDDRSPPAPRSTSTAPASRSPSPSPASSVPAPAAARAAQPRATPTPGPARSSSAPAERRSRPTPAPSRCPRAPSPATRGRSRSPARATPPSARSSARRPARSPRPARGTLTLSGANTFTGGTTVSAGIVRLQSNAALGTAAGSTTVAAGAEIDIDGSGLAIAEPIVSLAGTGTAGGGALRNLANANTWSGAITLVAASEVASDAGTLTLSGALANGGFDLTIDGAGNVTKTTSAISGAGGLTKAGAGTLALSVANSYTGATTVSGGTLRLGIANGVGASSALSVASGATFDLNGFSDTVGSVAGVAGSPDHQRRRGGGDPVGRPRRQRLDDLRGHARQRVGHGRADQDRHGHPDPLGRQHLHRRHDPDRRA